ncbi:MAG: N-carbamyl-D-amino acid amidohydrolase [Xanthobacteraceae bacterium]|nr:MAG: N-carbamyl-D-amino acid amidohydrolase [Xanthobacteraceae bacterium]
MSRIVTVGAAQMGAIQRAHSRREVVARMVELMREAASHRCDLVVFPELTLTTFFPRWWMEDQAEIDSRLGIGFSLGYAELTPEGRHYNTAILVNKSAQIVGKYRKIHLPGHAGHEPWRAFQHLEKRYFEVGDLSWGVWNALGGNMGMMICNDRRWPESYRMMGLQSVEMILLGYNTPRHNPPAPDHDRLSEFHNQLVMQAGAYQNGTWVVGVAKCGVEEGCEMIGGSSIIAPTGEVIGQALTQEDELIVARCDLDLTKSYKATTFNFDMHRQPDQYRRIVEQRGAVPPKG